MKRIAYRRASGKGVKIKFRVCRRTRYRVAIKDRLKLKIRGEEMKKIKKGIYLTGVCITFLAMAGFAESITGRGDTGISVTLMIVGFLLALFGYV